MVEKFSDFEGKQYLNKEGTFKFTINGAELKDSKKGEPMAVFTAECEEGQTTLYHSLNPKARWSYNNLIKACLKLDTREKINNFECDYETIHNELVGKTFYGVVEKDTYTREIKIPLDDGTFETGTEEKESFKVVEYKIAE